MLLDKCTSERVLMEADLVPMQGQRFQPTGFADLGAAVYTLHDGTRMLLVESVQSMANRLERTITLPDGNVIPDLDGISYVTAILHCQDGKSISTSYLLEAHRLASPFIIAGKTFQEQFCQEAGYDTATPLDWKRIYATIFRYDVNSLLHGVFFSTVKDGRIKVPRLISAFIEAENVREAVSAVSRIRLTRLGVSAMRTTTRMRTAMFSTSAPNTRRSALPPILIWMWAASGHWAFLRKLRSCSTVWHCTRCAVCWTEVCVCAQPAIFGRQGNCAFPALRPFLMHSPCLAA